MSKLQVLSLLAAGAWGHGMLTCPLPRQYRDQKPEVWTNYMGITTPGDGGFNPGVGNSVNLNAGVAGGVLGVATETTVGHGLCGDLGNRKGYMAGGPYGPDGQSSKGTFISGSKMTVNTKVTAYHAGWFEFRLCVPADGGTSTTTPITQDCLNEHVLTVDPSTPGYPAVVNYETMQGYNPSGSASSTGGAYKCAETGGWADPTSNTPNTVWPSGSCCNGGGACSKPSENNDRYVLEFAPDGGGVKEYEVVLNVPAGIECERCVLQWYYQTANSRDVYPEGFWNCADVQVLAEGTDAALATGCVSEAGAVSTGGGSGSGGSSSGGGGTVTPIGSANVGFCQNDYADVSGGKTASCIPCNTAADCPDTKACWGQSSCKEDALCGEVDVPDCQPNQPVQDFDCDFEQTSCGDFIAYCATWCKEPADAISVQCAEQWYPTTFANQCKCSGTTANGVCQYEVGPVLPGCMNNMDTIPLGLSETAPAYPVQMEYSTYNGDLSQACEGRLYGEDIWQTYGQNLADKTLQYTVFDDAVDAPGVATQCILTSRGWFSVSSVSANKCNLNAAAPTSPTSPTNPPATPTSQPATPTNPPPTNPASPTNTPATPNCVDKTASCQAVWCSNEYWASQCERTCNTCGGPTPTNPPTNSPTNPPTDPPTDGPATPTNPPTDPPTDGPATPTDPPTDGPAPNCVDKEVGCQANWCSSEHWKSQCEKTCGVCGGGDTPTPPPTPIALSQCASDIDCFSGQTCVCPSSSSGRSSSRTSARGLLFGGGGPNSLARSSKMENFDLALRSRAARGVVSVSSGCVCQAPVINPTTAPATPTSPPANPTPAPVTSPTSPTSDAPVFNDLNAVSQASRDKILEWEYAQGQYKPSTVYQWPDMVKGLESMSQVGVNGQKFWLGDGLTNYGLVSVAAFLSQSMKETIKYNVCDENNWDATTQYAASNACGQLGQSYQDYKCPDGQRQYECDVDPEMEIRASTSATWYGAPGPMFCAPKSKVPASPKWDHSQPWCNPALMTDTTYDGKPYDMDMDQFAAYIKEGEQGECRDYPGQKAGGYEYCANGGCPNTPGLGSFAGIPARTDVEGCCWWGRGVIQTTGICNFGKFNWFMGKKAFDRDGTALFPTIDFCKTPDAVCTSEAHPELKWIAGLFFWVQEVQTWNSDGFNYLEDLKAFVDGGMTDDSFINAVSGIVNRGCPRATCPAGPVDGLSDRKKNFVTALKAMGLE